MSTSAWHFDGKTAARRTVEVSAHNRMLRIDAAEYVDPDDLKRIDSPNGIVYGHKAIEGWRLGFETTPPPEIEALLPKAEKFGGIIDRFGLWKTVAIGTAISVGLVALALNSPEWVAPHIPFSVEQELGASMVGDLSSQYCIGGGQASLDSLAARLDNGKEPVRVHVVHFPIINAVTLPGGEILIFDKLLTNANSPDELAGVIGHEIGHVEHRDVMAGLIREFGLSLLLSNFKGSAAGNLNYMLSARYSRDVESKADDYAIDALRSAAISPQPTADFFQHMAKLEQSLGKLGTALSYTASHPMSEDRAMKFAHSAKPGTLYQPALSPEAWQTLRDICAKDPVHNKHNAFGI